MKKFDRKAAPPARGRRDAGARTPAPRFERRQPSAQDAGRARDDAALRDPYQRAQRPQAHGASRARGGGFTVTLDPDVARVFRGDASVNKALRLVMQLMEIAAPRPRFAGAGAGERPPRASGYRGSPEARGFTRKPRFEEEDE